MSESIDKKSDQESVKATEALVRELEATVAVRAWLLANNGVRLLVERIPQTSTYGISPEIAEHPDVRLYRFLKQKLKKVTSDNIE